jgi:hypothetical protein
VHGTVSRLQVEGPGGCNIHEDQQK